MTLGESLALGNLELRKIGLLLFPNDLNQFVTNCLEISDSVFASQLLNIANS